MVQTMKEYQMSTFNTRFAAAIKSYKNSSASLMSLVIEAIDYAESNQHNPVYINKILAAMDGGDVDHMATIVKAFGPFYVKDDGSVKLHGKAMAREYNVDRALVSSVKSFRTLAQALAGETKAKKAWELDKAAMAYAKACRAANVQDSAAHAAVTRAHVEIDYDVAAKEIATEVARVAKIVKAA